MNAKQIIIIMLLLIISFFIIGFCSAKKFYNNKYTEYLSITEQERTQLSEQLQSIRNDVGRLADNMEFSLSLTGNIREQLEGLYNNHRETYNRLRELEQSMDTDK